MAGILDSKQRIMDTIITKEGRRQIHDGELKIKFVSFTDRHTFYCDDGENVAESVGDRIFFEAVSRNQDQIIFETDDEGELLSFDGDDVKILPGGHLAVQGRTAAKAGYNDFTLQPVSTTDYALTSELINSLTDNAELNFKDQQIIASIDNSSDTSGFNFSPDYKLFRITRNGPIPSSKQEQVSIDNVDSLWRDRRLQHLPFYQYLPPVNVKRPYQESYDMLGNYPRLNQDPIIEISELERELEGREKVEFEFTETSRDNNIVMQFLEAGTGKVSKLAMIDFGEFPSEDPYSPGKRVFFVGKIFKDTRGMHTYINIFTVILE